MSTHIDIPKLFAACAEKVNTTFSTRTVDPFEVFFDYGHYDAVNKNLVSKSQSIDNKTRYPLIWLITPFEERKNDLQDYYCELSAVDLLILMNTSEGESIQTRVTNYFEPKLWPIWEELKVQMSNSGLFQILSPDAIPYDYTKDWFYQSGLQGKGNLFNDFIDALQIKNMRLRVHESVPETFNLIN